MASLGNLRTGLQTRLQTISGLRAYDVMPDKPELPAAIVTLQMPVSYDETFRSTTRWLFHVTMLVSRWDASRAQHNIDPYVSNTGTSSVKVAIEGDVKLGGVADSTRVRSVTRYGETHHAGLPYLAVEFDVEVFAE